MAAEDPVRPDPGPWSAGCLVVVVLALLLLIGWGLQGLLDWIRWAASS